MLASSDCSCPEFSASDLPGQRERELRRHHDTWLPSPLQPADGHSAAGTGLNLTSSRPTEQLDGAGPTAIGDSDSGAKMRSNRLHIFIYIILLTSFGMIVWFVQIKDLHFEIVSFS